MIDEREAFFQNLEEIFHGLSPSEPTYLLRKRAWDLFVEMGLPNRKEEAFQYLPLRKLYEEKFSPCTAAVSQEEIIITEPFSGSSLIFVNGVFRKDLSLMHNLPENIVVLSLEEANAKFGAFLQNRFTKQCKEEKDPFAMLNLSLYTGGAFLYVPPNVDCQVPVQVVHYITGSRETAPFIAPRLHVFVGSLSRLDVVVSLQTKNTPHFWMNGFMDVAVEEGASFSLTNASKISESAWSFDAVRMSAKRDSRVKSINLTNGAKTVRQSYHVFLTGENAEVELKGLQLLKGKNQAHCHVIMQHEAPYCKSMQLFKSVLQDVSQSSFEGKIFVQKKAQKTEAYQLNNNLLLGEFALCNSKPNLEIFADDVKASHGATVGRLRDEELFYLKTRGISEEEAKSLLLFGFCQEIVQAIPHTFLQKDLLPFVQNSLKKSSYV